MGAYRVLADDHWATDVVGGWLVGAAIGLVRRRARRDATHLGNWKGRRRGPAVSVGNDRRSQHEPIDPVARVPVRILHDLTALNVPIAAPSATSLAQCRL